MSRPNSQTIGLLGIDKHIQRTKFILAGLQQPL